MTALNHVVNSAIYNYPTLFRHVDYEQSRLLVLNQLFFVIGNGYEWHEDGYLYDNCSNYKPRKTLPKDFFNKKLFDVEINRSLINELKKEFKDRFFHIKKGISTYVIFEAKDREEAVFLTNKFRIKRPTSVEGFDWVFVHEILPNFKYNPYPLCEYSGLVEILNRKTNSPRCKNFDLVPQTDWLEGCLDIARHALTYYEDESKFSKNHYHHSNTTEKYKKEYENINIKKHWLDKLMNGETVEQFAVRMWKEYRNEQLDYLYRFINKFGKFFDDGVLIDLMGAQKSPSSVSKIQAENKFVKKELERIDNNVVD